MNNRSGLHKVLFNLVAVMTELGREGMTFAERPSLGAYFWSGDGKGVYLYYPGRFFYFVTVPGAVATRIDAPAFFSYVEDPMRQLRVLGSPAGSPDIIVLRIIKRDKNDTSPLCRLSILNPSGKELACLDEFRGRPGAAEATPRAMLVALDQRREEEGPWEYVYGQVRLYQLGAEGAWARSVWTDAADPHLRRDSLTFIAPSEGTLWVTEMSSSGLQERLFPVPAALLGLRSTGLCRWDDSGRCMFFADVRLLVRMRESPNEAKWP